jgi:peptidyl-prolyl cis-trans isomerase A (cyclophilin A)
MLSPFQVFAYEASPQPRYPLAVARTVIAGVLAALVLAPAAWSAQNPNPSLLRPATLKAKAPPVYAAAFKTTKGTFVVTVHRAWAPRGADRFYNLVRNGFYDDVSLFRVIPGFVVQFGISSKPSIARVWANANIRDDPVKHPNGPGTVTFADAGPNTRSTQVFVNLGDNGRLDRLGFAPFGAVTSGASVLGKLYSGYGEQPSSAQAQMTEQGKAFLTRTFPRLDRIVTARIVRR